MRKQYHSRPSENGRLIWDIDNLIELSSSLEVVAVPLEEILSDRRTKACGRCGRKFETINVA